MEARGQLRKRNRWKRTRRAVSVEAKGESWSRLSRCMVVTMEETRNTQGEQAMAGKEENKSTECSDSAILRREEHQKEQDQAIQVQKKDTSTSTDSQGSSNAVSDSGKNRRNVSAENNCCLWRSLCQAQKKISSSPILCGSCTTSDHHV